MQQPDADATLYDVYGLPEDTDLSDFIGRDLELVSIGLCQVALNFSGPGKVGITIEGDYAVSGPGAALVRYCTAPEGAAGLVGLLGSRVADVHVTDHGTTTIQFAEGSAITIYDSEEHHENYQIYIDDRLIVV